MVLILISLICSTVQKLSDRQTVGSEWPKSVLIISVRGHMIIVYVCWSKMSLNGSQKLIQHYEHNVDHEDPTATLGRKIRFKYPMFILNYTSQIYWRNIYIISGATWDNCLCMLTENQNGFEYLRVHTRTIPIIVENINGCRLISVTKYVKILNI